MGNIVLANYKLDYNGRMRIKYISEDEKKVGWQEGRSRNERSHPIMRREHARIEVRYGNKIIAFFPPIEMHEEGILGEINTLKPFFDECSREQVRLGSVIETLETRLLSWIKKE